LANIKGLFCFIESSIARVDILKVLSGKEKVKDRALAISESMFTSPLVFWALELMLKKKILDNINKWLQIDILLNVLFIEGYSFN